MLSNLFGKTLRDQRWSLLGWSIGLVALSFYLLYVYPFINRAGELLKVLDNLPPVIKNLIGKNNFLATPEGFLNLQPFSILAPLLFIIFAIAKGSDATAGEEERGTLDLLLANPLQRWQVVMEKFLAQALALFILGLVFWIGMAAGTRIFSIAVSWGRLAEVIFSCFLLGLVFLVPVPGHWLHERKKKNQPGNQQRFCRRHLFNQCVRPDGGSSAALSGIFPFILLQRQYGADQWLELHPMSWS